MKFRKIEKSDIRRKGDALVYYQLNLRPFLVMVFVSIFLAIWIFLNIHYLRLDKINEYKKQNGKQFPVTTKDPFFQPLFDKAQLAPKGNENPAGHTWLYERTYYLLKDNLFDYPDWMVSYGSTCYNEVLFYSDSLHVRLTINVVDVPIENTFFLEKKLVNSGGQKLFEIRYEIHESIIFFFNILLVASALVGTYIIYSLLLFPIVWLSVVIPLKKEGWHKIQKDKFEYLHDYNSNLPNNRVVKYLSRFVIYQHR